MEMKDDGEVKNNICCVRWIKSQNETINSLAPILKMTLKWS